MARAACRPIAGVTPNTSALLDARNIDRLNIGALPTVQLNWFQPHEGSIVDFLIRARAYQTTTAEAAK